MIRELHEADRQAILAYAYQKERENMFIIGNFEHADPFRFCRFLGEDDHGVLRGIAAVFPLYGSFVVHTSALSLLPALVDAVMERRWVFTSIPAFRRYAKPMVERLREEHGCVPKKLSIETVFLLRGENFQPVSSTAVLGTEADRDACALLVKEDSESVLTDEDRARERPEYTFVIHERGVPVSRATVQAFSRHYAQIGGVGTLPEYRRKGYGRQCVSALSAHCFQKGIEAVILYTANDNTPAQNLYKSLGFKPVDDFLIAEYA